MSVLKTVTLAGVCAIVVAAGAGLMQQARAADQPLDLDKNAVNGQESKVSTRVLQTYPIMIENTVYNNAPGYSYTFDWEGAGPGGFHSFLTAGPGVGTRWVWSTVYQVYSVQSPAQFTPVRALSVFGTDPQGVRTGGSTSGGSFSVPGKSIYPTQVTLSNASLSSSLITFFSPEKTVATCGVQCEPGRCDVAFQNLSGGTASLKTEQLDCCYEPHQIFCDGQCTTYLTDANNCGGCGVVCPGDQFCSEGACVCNPGLTECDGACVDAQSDEAHCGACGSACLADESCVAGGCLCDPGLTQCGAGCLDLATDPANCGACGNACYTDEFCSGGSCVCNAGLTQCGEGCLDLQTDSSNCGACGNVCPVGGICSGGACVCPLGQVDCGGTCVELQKDPLNCGACGNACGADAICEAGSCQTCRPPRGTACDNQCVNTHTDPLNCGACGFVCDFSGCPSSGQGACSQGSSCVCAPAVTTTTDMTSTLTKQRMRFKPVNRRSRSPRPTVDPSPRTPEGGTARTLHQSPVRSQDFAAVATSTSAVVGTASSRPGRLSVMEAPVCDLAPIEQSLPSGGTYTQTQVGGRFGKEIQTSVSIKVNGTTIAQGPCPLIVPVTDVDTSGVILSPASVAVQDTSGDGLCQPGEARCEYLITVASLGDSACLGPQATLTSPPNDFDSNPITFLNDTSAYPDLPAYPGDGVPLDQKTNTTPFAITTLPTQLPDVGRPFVMNVLCTNLPQPVVMPITLGIGSSCDPGTRDSRSYDSLTGFQAPVKARLVAPGAPIDFSTGNFNHGSTIPLKLSLGCGAVTLSGDQINPKPQIVSLEHTTLGSQSLLGINGDNNANPDNPAFSCSSSTCDFQFRTEHLPVGTYIIGVQLPDTRVFRAGFTISP